MNWEKLDPNLSFIEKKMRNLHKIFIYLFIYSLFQVDLYLTLQ